MERSWEDKQNIILRAPFQSARVHVKTKQNFYKPWILGPSAILSVLAVTLALIGLIEYALHTLPKAHGNGITESAGEALSSYYYSKRALNYTSTITTNVQGHQETLAVTYVDPCPPGATCAPPPQYWLPVGTKALGDGNTGPSTPKTTLPVATFPSTTRTVPVNPVATTPYSWHSVGPTSSSNDNSRSSPSKTPLSIITSTIPLSPATTTVPTAPPPQYWNNVLTRGQYFLGAFLPTMLAVLFTLPWLFIDGNVRKLEPFHQLAKSQGAFAGKSLFADYSSQLKAPFKALFSGHWTPVLTSILSMTSLLITPLAPETVAIRTDDTCHECGPSLSIYPLATRVVESLLCFMAFMTLILLLHMRRYSTGVFADPSSLAGVAILFHNRDVVDDFRQTRGFSKSLLRTHLSRHQYTLDFYEEHDGSRKYGIIPQEAPAAKSAARKGESICFEEEIQPSIEQSLQSSHAHRTTAAGLIILLLGLLAVIVYYKFTYDPNSGFEQFMDTQGFGVKFLFTSIGVMIKLYWSAIFKDVTQFEAYSALAKRNSTAQSSILVSSCSHPITAIVPTMLRGHIFVTLIASAAFLAEILTVSLSNIQYKAETTFMAYTICTWLSSSIITFMIIALVALVFHRQPSLPTEPSNIAATLSLLAWSSIPRRFSDMALLGEGTRNEIIRSMNLRYGIGVNGYESERAVVGIDVEVLDFRT